jgi:outer membrane protein OmpA-like peptidoglycan-associated protein
VGWRWVAGLVIVTVVATGCAPKRSLIVLLPDDDGKVGRVEVWNDAGSVDLVEAHSATEVVANQPPGRVMLLKEADVTRKFGETLRSLPVAPHRFTLLFQFDSETLTDESTRLVPTIVTAVKDHAAHEVVIVGHTDRMGTVAANFALGLQRAAAVRNLLVAAGLDGSIVALTSLGESSPVVRAADETPEPRNRRVEVAMYARQP